MIDGHRVVAMTPFGRRRTYSLQVPYLLRAHREGVLDEVMLYINPTRTSLTQPEAFHPDQADDIAYAHQLAEQHPGLFKVYKSPGPDTPDLAGMIPDEWMRGYRDPKQMNTMRIHWYTQDRRAVYLRFDDDVIWLHRDAIATLARVKIASPHRLGVFPIIWNNAVSSHFLQKWGVLDTRMGQVGLNAVDQLGWGNPVFAKYVHETLLDALESGDEDRFLRWEVAELDFRQQFSVSCFAVHGREYADLGGVLNWDEEEHWLTMHQTGIVGRHNVVNGLAHVAHYSFFTQRDWLDRNTDILARYGALAAQVDSAPVTTSNTVTAAS